VSRPRPSPRVVAPVLVVCSALLVYAVLALGNPLVGLFPFLLVVAGYFAWRFLLAVEAVGAGLQRIAAALEDD
jgi:hypothetical protein